MVRSRWVRWLGPGVAAWIAVAAIVSTTLGAGDRPWAPSACEAGIQQLAGAARLPAPLTVNDLGTEPWFRIDAALDRDGSLRAQRLLVGIGADRLRRASELPAESFVAGPFGRLLLVGTDDGSSSRIAAFDVARDCSWPVATERDVIRRATLDPATGTIYETRVDRATRADLGVWRRPLDGTTGAAAVLDAPPPDERFGRTFSTEFAWDASGTRLLVQSCGEVACRARFVVAEAGTPDPPLDPEAGPLVGLAGDELVGFAACRGRPCPIVATDLETGARRIVEPLADRATVMPEPDRTRVVVERLDGVARQVVALDLDDDTGLALGSAEGGLDLVTPLDAASGMRVPSGWILLGPDGRLPDDQTPVRPRLRRISDGLTVGLDEVAS
jgi:hypothetical protein